MGVVAFTLFGGLLLAFMLLVIFSRHPAYAVLYFLAGMFCLSALYVMLGAYFVATLQIVLYAGAVLVMFLFVVMLLSLNEDTEGEGRKLARTAGAVLAFSFFVIIFNAIRGVLFSSPPESIAGVMGGVRQIGMLLFTDYLFPFEVTSLLILAAMIGAIVIGKGKMEGNS